MKRGTLKKETFEAEDPKKEECHKEMRRNIIVGSILRSIHKQQRPYPTYWK